MNQIVQQNEVFAENVSTKRTRIAQVQREISEELGKDVLDPMAVGLRYVEIESLNRQINDDEKAVRKNDRMALNDAQRAKVKIMEEARALKTAIAGAECETMLDPLPALPPLPLVVINGLPIGDLSLLRASVPGQLSCGGFTFNGVSFP